MGTGQFVVYRTGRVSGYDSLMTDLGTGDPNRDHRGWYMRVQGAHGGVIYRVFVYNMVGASMMQVVLVKSYDLGSSKEVKEIVFTVICCGVLCDVVKLTVKLSIFLWLSHTTVLYWI